MKIHQLLGRWRRHSINIISNILEEDMASMIIRRALLKSIGVKFGNNVHFCGGGYVHGGSLEIGDNTFINRDCYFDLSAAILIGKNISIGHHTRFITAGHEIGPSERRCGRAVREPIVVEDGAWIGANVTILPGVTIGQGAVVGANSLVTKNIPANQLFVGQPARFVRMLEVVSPITDSSVAL